MNSDLILLGRRTIRKEADALLAFVDCLDESFAKACEMIFQCKGTILLTGMGKSGLVARKWVATLAGTGTKAYFINPAEASHGDLGILRQDDMMIALSYSGETEELSHTLRYARSIAMPTIGVTGNPLSSLARQVDLLLLAKISEEACPLGLAPTTSTTVMMALGDALATTVMQMRGFGESDFARLHPGGSLGRRLWLRVSELMHKGDEVPFSGPNDSLEDVLVQMTSKRLGLSVVRDQGKILGIITDGDLRRFFQKEGVHSPCDAKRIMTSTPVSIDHNALAVEARECMERYSIHHLLVMDGENLAGVVHFQDLLRGKVV